VERFRARHAAALERHAFVQFELDRQLARAAREGERAGLAVGLYTDLAIGGAPSGFDAWAFRALFVPGVEVGAPPDAYNRAGQAWGFAPLHPGRLGTGGLGFLARLLRANLRHAGALRIDHVLGFFRQWWIPPGAAPDAGAYVRFPARALLGLVALEARRAGALVIGEDLGTVPAEVPATLARHGVLSSRVMLFERDRKGGFRPARRYSTRALVTANTHDLPTLAGWFAGRDLELRRALGLVSARAHAQACRERRRECAALLARLRRDGHLAGPLRELAPAERLAAVNRFLCATPAPLVGVSLEDLAGETEPVNLPGVGAGRHPSWTRRLAVPFSRLARSEETRVALAGAAARARRPRA
jgi:4-alpha-glucanotransferase